MRDLAILKIIFIDGTITLPGKSHKAGLVGAAQNDDDPGQPFTWSMVLTSYPTADFTTHLARQLATDPRRLEWPREFMVTGASGSLPAVFDPHNALLTIHGARTTDFSGPELHPWLTIGPDTAALCSRVLVYATPGDQQKWAGFGFKNEGTIQGYWSAGGAACLWARNQGERAKGGLEAGPPAPEKLPPSSASDPRLPAAVVCRVADVDDAMAIGNLLRQVFPHYPIPADPGVIRYALASGQVHGRLIRHAAGSIVSYASVEFQPGGGSAEITDCVTLPEFRGQGMMTHLVRRLLEDLDDVFECRHGHSLAREDEPAMQSVLARCGWLRTGYLVNHFRVGGDWKSAYLWQA